MIYRERKSRYISAFKIPYELPININCVQVSESVPNFDSVCEYCNKKLKEHYIIDLNLICPGTYVICEGESVVNVMSSENFEQLYEPLGDVEDESC